MIDSGIQPNHPDLSAKIIASADFGGTGTVNDTDGHGTHVAGIVAAVTNNTTGIAGVCPDCTLMIAKAADANGEMNDITTSDGIRWAVDNGANVINMSFGSTQYSQRLADATLYAAQRGVYMAAAAGNMDGQAGNPTYRGQPFYPAYNDYVESVAAADNSDNAASFSNSGDIASYGVNIYSTYKNSSYQYLSGTSMATPVVAGIAGLVYPFCLSNSSALYRYRD